MSEKPPAPSVGQMAKQAAMGTVRSPRASIPPAVALNLTSGIKTGNDKIVIYGPSGVGKTFLASWAPAPIIFDTEDSSKKLEVTSDLVETFMDMRGKLRTFSDAPINGVRSVFIDTITVLEELIKEHVIATRVSDGGRKVDSIEAFSWGKGWQYVYDEFVAILLDLDRIAALGLNVGMIAHDIISEVPNPAGENYIRWEPSVFGGSKRGTANIRNLIKNWADHVLFIKYDVSVSQAGKGQGAGTRTIYTQELPTHVAKSRTQQVIQPFTLDDPGAIWKTLGVV